MSSSVETFTLAMSDMEFAAFDDYVRGEREASLEVLAEQDPFGAYMLAIEESFRLGTINGVTPANVEGIPTAISQNLIITALKRSIPDPYEQAVRVEVSTYPALPTRRQLKGKAEPSIRVLGFIVPVPPDPCNPWERTVS